MINLLSNIQWIFDGIGTELISVIVGLIVGGGVGGCVGYRIGTKNKVKQIQKAQDNAKQNQTGAVNIYSMNEDKKMSDKQLQKQEIIPNKYKRVIFIFQMEFLNKE